MGRGPYSRYVLVVDNLSSSTTSKDIAYEFEVAGPVRDVARDYKARSSDAKYAWQKMDGFKMDGRRWKVDWASADDFDMFNWKWFESGRGRSPSPARGRSRSRSPPTTPHDKDRKRGNSASPASPAGRPRSRSRSPRREPAADE